MRYILIPLLLFFLTGCGWQPKKPEVSVGIESLRMLPSNGIVPRFEIGLHVVNTSPVDLHIKGVVYKLYLAGRKVLTGAAHDLPKIAAYSEADLKVTGSPDIFETIGFFKDLMTKTEESVDYEVDVAIDTGTLLPMLHTKKKGVLSLLSKR